MDKLPQRLLLMSLHLRHRLKIKPRQMRREEKGKKGDNYSRCLKNVKNLHAGQIFNSKSSRSI